MKPCRPGFHEWGNWNTATNGMIRFCHGCGASQNVLKISSRPLLCRFGFHKWTAWETIDESIEFASGDEIMGRKTAKENTEKKQERYCSRIDCPSVERRIVRKVFVSFCHETRCDGLKKRGSKGSK